MDPNGYLKKSAHWHPMNDFLKMIFFIIYIYIYIKNTCKTYFLYPNNTDYP